MLDPASVRGERLGLRGRLGGPSRENFPHSKQTQVTGANNLGITVGSWVNKKGVNRGFYATNGHHFKIADYPTTNPANPAFDQMLGVNDHNVAVGFYNDSKGNSHGHTYAIAHKHYGRVGIPGARVRPAGPIG